MATPLLEILEMLFIRNESVDTAALREQGYSEIDGADIQEAILAMADTMPSVASAQLIEVADTLDLEGQIGLEGAAAALSSAQDAYVAILEAEGLDSAEAAALHSDAAIEESDLEIDIEVDTGAGESSIDIHADGSDPDIEISSDADPAVEVTIDGVDYGDMFVDQESDATEGLLEPEDASDPYGEPSDPGSDLDFD